MCKLYNFCKFVGCNRVVSATFVCGEGWKTEFTNPNSLATHNRLPSNMILPPYPIPLIGTFCLTPIQKFAKIHINQHTEA